MSDVAPGSGGFTRQRKHGDSDGQRTSLLLGLAIALASGLVLWLAGRNYDQGRPDYVYLADAFLHGRAWLETALSPLDVILRDGRVYLPFGPLPAIAFMPIVWVVGRDTATAWAHAIDAGLAATSVGLLWLLLTRIGVSRQIDRLWLVILFAFSTQMLWVTVRGGVWHTAHQFAVVLTLAALVELLGQRRAWLVGLVAGAAFLTRAPLAFAIPFYALALWPTRAGDSVSPDDGTDVRVARGRLVGLAAGVAPSVALFFLYNVIRFGDPVESGYALATVPDFLDRERQLGLFSLAHLAKSVDYFLLKLPTLSLDPPFLIPDGFGMSVVVTSPGLLYALRANWLDRRARWMAGAAIAVLIPSLLYYGGGWVQYGYRYFLDSVPFVLGLCGMAAAYRGRIGAGWKLAIAIGVLVMGASLYWVPRL